MGMKINLILAKDSYESDGETKFTIVTNETSLLVEKDQYDRLEIGQTVAINSIKLKKSQAKGGGFWTKRSITPISIGAV